MAFVLIHSLVEHSEPNAPSLLSEPSPEHKDHVEVLFLRVRLRDFSPHQYHAKCTLLHR